MKFNGLSTIGETNAIRRKSDDKITAEICTSSKVGIEPMPFQAGQIATTAKTIENTTPKPRSDPIFIG